MKNNELKVGMKSEISRAVTYDHSAEAFGSGEVVVYATPCLILQMEQAAREAVQPFLENGLSTVGTKVDIEHIAPTPVGMMVTAKATLREIDGRKLIYDIEAWDEVETVGRGTHERFIIGKENFTLKAQDKLNKK